MKQQTNNQILLESALENYGKNNGIEDKNEIFDLFSIEQITKNLEISSEEINDGLFDGGGDGGIDAILFFCNKASFDDISNLNGKGKGLSVEIQIVQNKNSENIDEDVLTRLISSFTDIFDLSKDLTGGTYSPAFIEKAFLIREVWKYISTKHEKLKINIFYISKAEFNNLSDSFLNKKNQLVKILNDNQIENELNLVGAKELLELSRAKEDYSATLEFAKITNNKRGDGYIGFVSLENYFDCITDNEKNLRTHIFEDNVRDHLSGREINNEIMETLRSEKKENFWCLNNGITIISSEISPLGDTLNMKNIQIVNGLQTSYQIFNAKNNGVDLGKNNFLIVKVVKTDEKELKTDIIKCTNRQNPVETSGFRALDKIQYDIEDFFKKESFYYDRRKNYYKNQGISTNKIVSIQLVAQCVFSMIYKEPSIARSKPVSLLKEEINYQKSFTNIGDNLWLFLLLIQLFKQVDVILRRLKNEYKKDETKEIERIIAANYKFHVCRVLMSVLLKNNDFSLKDIIKEKKFLVKEEGDKKNLEKLIIKALNQLVIIVKKYLDDNKKTVYDLISISKNPTFDKEITNLLQLKS